MNFGDQDIIKCLNKLFLTNYNRISWLVLVIYMHVINHDVGGVIFKSHHNQMITNCLYDLFLAIVRTHRIRMIEWFTVCWFCVNLSACPLVLYSHSNTLQIQQN